MSENNKKEIIEMIIRKLKYHTNEVKKQLSPEEEILVKDEFKIITDIIEFVEKQYGIK